jgi:hypothetical protein
MISNCPSVFERFLKQSIVEITPCSYQSDSDVPTDKVTSTQDITSQEVTPNQEMSPDKEGGPPRPREDAPEEEWREYMSYYYTREETTYCGIPVLTRPPPGDW